MIEVVAGFIEREGRVLLTQRRDSQDCPFTWGCPSGKVAGPHESHHDALRRKLREELGIDVGRIAEHSLFCGKLTSVSGPSGPSDVSGVFLLILAVHEWRSSPGVWSSRWTDPAPREYQGIGWFTPEEMSSLRLTPGNEAARAEIAQAVRMRERSRQQQRMVGG